MMLLKFMQYLFFIIILNFQFIIAGDQYVPIHSMVNIGAHKLHLISMGETFKGQNPTIVFEHGLHSEGSYWFDIQKRLVDHNIYSISYDRAGLGLSEVSSKPRTAAHIIHDLHILLEKAEIPQPYILVGYSFGGLCVQLYCVTYPSEIAGMVLIDSVHENMLQDMPLKMIESWELQKNMLFYMQYVPLIVMRQLAFDREKNKLKKMQYPEEYVDQRIENIFKPHYFSTLYNEMKNIYISFNQVRESSKDFGNIPLIVIIADDFEDVSAYGCGKLSDFDQETQDLFIATCQKHKQEQVNRSTSHFKQLLIAQGCSHRIPLENPHIIISSIVAILDKINMSRL